MQNKIVEVEAAFWNFQQNKLSPGVRLLGAIFKRVCYTHTSYLSNLVQFAVKKKCWAAAVKLPPPNARLDLT